MPSQELEQAALLGPFPVPWRHPVRCAIWLVRSLFGLSSLVLLLAVIAAVPVLNFVAFGYLLEAEGRVARSGRFRDAWPLFRLAPRIGSIALGVFLWLIPLQVLGARVADAAVIDPGGAAVTRLANIRLFVSTLIAVHLCLAIARGGTLGCFIRPLRNVLWFRKRLRAGSYWETATAHVVHFVRQLQIRHHFWLGLRGYVGGLIWVAIPTGMLAFYTVPQRTSPFAVLVSVLGGLLLIPVFCWLPFLQARFAAENRFGAFFELSRIRSAFRHAPLLWFCGSALLFVLCTPLYLTKVALLPADAMWLITGVFIVTMYPARIVSGWVYHRGIRTEGHAFRGSRWLARLAMIAICVVYVLVVFFSQSIGEHGKAAMFENHAFLLPVPF